MIYPSKEDQHNPSAAQRDLRSSSTQPSALAERCVSIDLEVDPSQARIFSFAAVKVDRKERLVFQGDNLRDALRKLDHFTQSSDYILGHNINDFDAVHLDAVDADLKLLRKPTIDTLWLNPLAFPRNPYHNLVKHYKDGRLNGAHVNDPELDAGLVFDVLQNQIQALSDLNDSSPELLSAYHWLTTVDKRDAGFDAVFSAIRDSEIPESVVAKKAIGSLLNEQACNQRIEDVAAKAHHSGWSLAYALAWISVAGGDSVMPPWVRHKFPDASGIVRQLRNTPCSDPWCTWCRLQNDPKGQLKEWFGFDSFRKEPKGPDGQPLQEAIVATAMDGESVLGILPTGTGKSVCYQLPALSRFHKTGDLTVVISPLVALMVDQVEGLRRQGITSCVAINGLLSLPERADALDQVRLGEAAILLISPEQLRNRSVRSTLKQRQIGYWVLDEAHCLSKWGHDFRPDYRYVARFIKEYSGDESPAPILCLTATAKPDVLREILDHFRDKLNVAMSLIDGGAVRQNLLFDIVETNQNRKLGDIVSVLQDNLPDDGASGAIIYCATRASTERVAEFLKSNGFAAEHFHAGLKPQAKREVQERFLEGNLRVIAATNAFGMGIDKSNIRLVVHGDIPGSIENYVQEAGRAGRDRAEARCVLLFCGDDIERQFNLSARSRLSKQEIAAILKALRRLDKRTKRTGEVIATSGEIVKEELDQAFVRDSATDDTRVKTAVAWLEEAELLTREENRIHILPSTLKIRTLKDAKQILQSRGFPDTYRGQLLDLIHRLMGAEPDEGISTDELSTVSGLSGSKLRKALHDLENAGIASNETKIVVFVHLATENSSSKRFKAVAELEADLIERLRELANDLELGTTSQLNLKLASQELRDVGHKVVRPDVIDRIIRGIGRDGRDEDEGIGSLSVRKLNREQLSIRLQRPWEKLARTAELRRLGAEVLLRFLQGRAPRNARGNDIQIEATLGELMSALSSDLEIAKDVAHPSKLLDRSLLWLHEQGIIVLGQGLTVFRPAITIFLERGSKRFTNEDFKQLHNHYEEQTLQIHVMEAYARKGLTSNVGAQDLVQDYFTMSRSAFLKKWLPGRGAEICRQTTPQSWHAIVEALENAQQAEIVSDDREQTNILVLAGPGSGKTRVLVHRIAYLIRVRRENPKGILVLVYNRHAATEIKRRLLALIGDDAAGVTVSTCHGLAMRLVGASFAKRFEEQDSDKFDKVIQEAVSLLRGEGLSLEEAEAQRETLVEGYRWILVDEYQDIGRDEYDLIEAVAGRSLEDEDSRLSLFAVGDDDQNIYAFAGASVDYIRRFEQDYSARTLHLVENYRSTEHIIHAANRVIAPAMERMKAGHDIVVNRARREAPEGGDLAEFDPVASGHVQIIRAGPDRYTQAIVALNELKRLSKLLPDWDWTKVAIIARAWRILEPVRSYCESQDIPVRMANEDISLFWRLRETQAFLEWLKARSDLVVSYRDILAWLDEQPDGPWWAFLAEAAGDFNAEFGDQKAYIKDVLDWLADWGREVRKKQTSLLLLTAHRAKGLEFDHVIVLDGGWDHRSKDEDADAARRLFYVAMTRARHCLALMQVGPTHPILNDVKGCGSMIERKLDTEQANTSACRQKYERLELKEIFLSFAGRLPSGHQSIDAIEALDVGDPIALTKDDRSYVVTDQYGTPVGKLAQGYRPPDGEFVRGSVFAIIKWRADDSDEIYRNNLRRSSWEVVVPELVFDTN